MNNDNLLDDLKTRGFLQATSVARWHDASELLAVVDAIGREGSSAVIKVDGARENKAVYTVVLSGGSLGEDYFRKDGADLISVLQEAISFYQNKVWSKR